MIDRASSPIDWLGFDWIGFDRLGFDWIGIESERKELAPRLESAIGRVLQHGRFIGGPEVAQLEMELSARTDSHCVTCANGTDALTLALAALGVGPGDGVFVPAFTFVATASAVVARGAIPIWVDVDPRTRTLDPASLALGIDRAARGLLRASDGSLLRARAIIAVDLFGQPADMRAILPLAGRLDLPVIEDGAQSLGASLDGRTAPALGRVGTTSFFPTKPLGAYGDGGALFVSDQHLAEDLRARRSHGRNSAGRAELPGQNSRLDTLQAGILLAKLPTFDRALAERRALAQKYLAALGDLFPGGGLPLADAAESQSSWAQFAIAVSGRDQVRARLAEVGIPTTIHYPEPLHQLPAFRGRSVALPDLRGSELLSRTLLSLPLHPYLPTEATDFLLQALRRALEEAIDPPPSRA